MAHYSRLSRIVVDAPEAAHEAEVAFWQGALGVPLTQVAPFPEYHGAQLDGGFGLLAQRLTSGEPRVHLDIHTNDRDAEVARLERLGATVVDASRPWTIMRDPAGLLFCVVADRTVDASNAHCWND